MISHQIQDAFNDQLNAELYSAYLYLSMSAYFESMNLKGFANWMRTQAQEEMLHAMKFYSFINDRGGRVVLSAIDGPPVKWDSPLAAFEDAYRHEQKVTGLINNLVDLAIAGKGPFGRSLFAVVCHRTGRRRSFRGCSSAKAEARGRARSGSFHDRCGAGDSGVHDADRTSSGVSQRCRAAGHCNGS